MKRSAGILLPISSLPSKYGIGSLGKEAKDFVDYLSRANQSYWQILPLGPTSYGDSPYSALSAFAGNPYFIDLDELNKEGLLKKNDYKHLIKDYKEVDYAYLFETRFKVLKIAVNNLIKKDKKKLEAFIKKEKDWLDDYALYMAIKDKLGGKEVEKWPLKLRLRDKEELSKQGELLKEEILFYEGIQYLFFKQWNVLKKYANSKGIKIIGDIPIYIARDSADIWANPKQFQLDKKGKPKKVAGVPPDYFTKEGQLWGNPVYDWSYMKKDNYKWWIARIKQQFRFYDVIRLDHFRGFEAYYTISPKAKNAIVGKWEKGPDISLFKAIHKELGKKEIIAEDLGFLTDKVYKLLEETGYPGMVVLEFAFDPNDRSGKYLPHSHKENSVEYLGTHDNDTIMGWKKLAPKTHINKAKEYFNIKNGEPFNWGMIKGAYSSPSKLVIIQFQDVVGLGIEARINTPATLGNNWKWMAQKEMFKTSDIQKLKKLTYLYHRERRD